MDPHFNEACVDKFMTTIPTDENIGELAKLFASQQGQVPTAFAFQEGARWVRELWRMQEKYMPNETSLKKLP